MERNQDSPVVVVGAGIVGCSIAVHLLDRGVRPLLIDADRPGQGASAGSFASISAFGKDPAAWFQLAVAGVSGWSRFAGRLGGGVGLRRAGEVRVAGDPAEGRALARQVADARGRGYPVRPVDGAELRRLLPEARLGPVAAAASFAPQRRAGRAAAGAGGVPGRAGAGRGPAAAGPPRPGPPGRRRRAGRGGRRAAAPPDDGAGRRRRGGPGGRRGRPGRPDRVQPRPAGRDPALPALTDKVVYLPGDPGPPVHLRQRPDGRVLVGERSQETVASDPGRRRARAPLAQAARFFPALAGTPVERWWLAWRAMPADRLPIVGPVPWLDQLYLAVTHSGVTLAPALGRLVAREVADDIADGLLAPFRPGRFAERTARVMLEVESVFREPTRQDRST
jgi:glycine/D-amino acid oxidase-like deaminating enzyme